MSKEAKTAEGKIKCPVCKGKGSIAPPQQLLRRADKRLVSAAVSLREIGYTIREIAKLLGYEHPGSISHLLKDRE